MFTNLFWVMCLALALIGCTPLDLPAPPTRESAVRPVDSADSASGGSDSVPAANDTADSGGQDSSPPATTDPFDGQQFSRVLFLGLDTTRADSLVELPTLASLAKTSISFRAPLAGSPYTMVSLPEMLTGTQQPQDGVIWDLSQSAQVMVPDGAIEVSQALKQAGSVSFAARCDEGTWWQGSPGLSGDYDTDTHTAAGPASVVDCILAAAEAAEDQSAFIGAWFMGGHIPYDPDLQAADPDLQACLADVDTDVDFSTDANYDDFTVVANSYSAEDQAQVEAYMACCYAAELRQLDAELARLFDQLALDESTLVVVMNDHGEGLGDGCAHQMSWAETLTHGSGLCGQLTAGITLFGSVGLEPQLVPAAFGSSDLLPALLQLTGGDTSQLPSYLQGRELPWQRQPDTAVLASELLGTAVVASEQSDLPPPVAQWRLAATAVIDGDVYKAIALVTTENCATGLTPCDSGADVGCELYNSSSCPTESPGCNVWDSDHPAAVALWPQLQTAAEAACADLASR